MTPRRRDAVTARLTTHTCAQWAAANTPVGKLCALELVRHVAEKAGSHVHFAHHDVAHHGEVAAVAPGVLGRGREGGEREMRKRYEEVYPEPKETSAPFSSRRTCSGS